MIIKPLGTKVLIKMLEGEAKTKSGIILSTKKEDKPQMAQVISVGREVEQVKENEKIIVSRYIGTQVKIDGEEYIILQEKEILAKWEE